MPSLHNCNPVQVHLPMVDKETIAVYDAQIDSYTKMVKRDKTDPMLLAFISRIKPGGHVLDLGCGPAHSSATLRDHGFQVDPVDASPEMVRLANSTFEIGARQAGFNDISGSEVYDGIWANFSLLHAPAGELPALLKTLAATLKPGGFIHLGMKLGQGSKRDTLGRYYSYYSEEELTGYLKQCDIDVVKTKHAEGKGLAGDIEPWIMLQGTLARPGN